ALIATLDYLQHSLPGAQGGAGLLSLVPPQAPEIEIKVPSAPPTPRPHTPMPATTPIDLRPGTGAKSGGTKLLPSEPGTRRGGGPESRRGRGGWGAGARRSRGGAGGGGGGVGMGRAVLGGAAGGGTGVYFLLGSEGSRVRGPPAAESAGGDPERRRPSER